MIKTVHDIIRLFNYSAAWNALEALIYQSLFLLHYGFLFYAIGATDYGVFSTGISILYAWVMIGNLGFDYTLAPFFVYIKADRSSFIRYFYRQWVAQIILMSMNSLLFYLFFSRIMPEQFIHNGMLPILMTILLFSESIKKSLRILLNLALYNKATACIEIATISTYMIIVWTYYYRYQHVSLDLLIIPLLITSVLSGVALHACVHWWYTQLPTDHQSLTEDGLTGRIIKNRFYTTFYSITQQIFSSNVLIPAIAYKSGMNTAGVFNMLSTIVYSITHVFYKISASSSSAAFAWAKKQTLAFKQEMFSLVWNELSKVASMATILLIVNQMHIATSSFNSFSKETILQGYAYIGILIIEFFAVTYEKFYFTEEKANKLVLLQLLVIISAGITIAYSHVLSTTHILEILFTIRMISFILLMIQSFRIWNLKPEWRQSKTILIYGIPFAILLYWILKISIGSIK